MLVSSRRQSQLYASNNQILLLFHAIFLLQAGSRHSWLHRECTRSAVQMGFRSPTAGSFEWISHTSLVVTQHLTES